MSFLYRNIDVLWTEVVLMRLSFFASLWCQEPWGIEIILWSLILLKFRHWVQYCSRDICWQARGTKAYQYELIRLWAINHSFCWKYMFLHSCLGWGKKWRHRADCQLANLYFKLPSTKCEGFVTNRLSFLLVWFLCGPYWTVCRFRRIQRHDIHRVGARVWFLNTSLKGTSWVWSLEGLDRHDPLRLIKEARGFCKFDHIS